MYTYRGVQVDEDGARNIFAATCLGEESIVRTGIASILGSFCVNCSIVLETVLKEITVCLPLLSDSLINSKSSMVRRRGEWR